MATKKTTARKTVSSSKARAKALKNAVRVQRPESLAQLIERQESAKLSLEATREALVKALEKDASEARIEALIAERDEATEMFAEARFTRWGAMHADRAIERADGSFPASVEGDSNGIRMAIVARLTAQLNYERSRSQPDAERIKAIGAALRTARTLVD
jgi:hypothetical protein